MKVKKTFAALFTSVLSVAFLLLATVLIGAACSEKVTLRFETGGGTHIDSVEGRAGGEYQKPQEPGLDGYYFDGWFLDPSCTGEPQDLPDVMPAESTTYYAKYGKYPILTLCGDGGVELMRLEVKPGADLNERLKGLAPEREGLLFGGWSCGGELLPDGAVMGADDMTLTARYKARCTVDVYLQLADEPERYERDPMLSLESADWVGTEYAAQVPVPSHFVYRADRSSPTGTLRAGSNVFALYFDREEFSVTLDPSLPEGGERQELAVRYGATLALERPQGGEGYTFLGWRTASGDHAAGEVLTLTEPLTLKGVWAKAYPNALGEGTLLVELGEEPDRRAVYLLGEERLEGEFHEAQGTFSAGELRGRLEPHGGFLPDDSGSYLGCDLTLTEKKELGTLTLDFFGGRARYECGETQLEGAYAPLYDETAARYTGEYSLDGGFRFRLYASAFLREGEERGSYTRLVGGSFRGGTLTLDGYGNATLCTQTVQTGRYYRGDADWHFVPEEGGELCFLLGGRKWTDGGTVAVENAFLLKREELFGTYTAGEDSLILDGYGVGAVLVQSGQKTEAPFTREGDVVTLFCDPVLRFTLHGETFSPTSGEEGSYRGERGVLYLNGAGGATLRGERSERGSYIPSGEGFAYEGASRFLFRLRGEEYDVYDEARAGTYENYFYETALTLDGFGGGTCYLTAGEGFPVRLLYADETILLLYSEAFNSPRKTVAFRIDPEGYIVELPSVEAGIYPVWENGRETGERLLLDGMGGARLLVSGETGEYTYSRRQAEAVCSFGEGACTYLLRERAGETCCVRSLLQGVYEGEEGTLTLDGYGGALLGGQELSYSVKQGAAELGTEDALLRFTLGRGTYTVVRYRRYTNPFGEGELFLGQGSILAILRGAEERYGTYGLDTFLSEGRSFLFRLKGDEFFVYDEAQRGEFATPEGDTLTLDGCGGGTLTRGGEVYTGRAALKEGIAVFASEELYTLSGQMGFAVENGVLRPLGEEFGEYLSRDGICLSLSGDGRATLSGENGPLQGVYDKISEDVYRISVPGADFCVRLGEGRWAQWHETLALYADTYGTEEGTLRVDGCGVTLTGERETAYGLVCACEGGFIAQELATGEYFRFDFTDGVRIGAVSPELFVCG